MNSVHTRSDVACFAVGVFCTLSKPRCLGNAAISTTLYRTFRPAALSKPRCLGDAATNTTMYLVPDIIALQPKLGVFACTATVQLTAIHQQCTAAVVYGPKQAKRCLQWQSIGVVRVAWPLLIKGGLKTIVGNWHERASACGWPAGLDHYYRTPTSARSLYFRGLGVNQA